MEIYANNCVVHKLNHWRHTLHNRQSIGRPYFMKLADQLEGVHVLVVKKQQPLANKIAPVCACRYRVCVLVFENISSSFPDPSFITSLLKFNGPDCVFLV